MRRLMGTGWHERRFPEGDVYNPNPPILAAVVHRTQQLEPQEYYRFQFFSWTPVQELEQCLMELQEAGLDVGRCNDRMFGYKMPLPVRGDHRYLIIFRRR